MHAYLSAEACLGELHAYLTVCWRHHLMSCNHEKHALSTSVQHTYVAEHLAVAAAVPETSKHSVVKQAWEFLHTEGHINQGILQGEPADKTRCGPLACILCMMHVTLPGLLLACARLHKRVFGSSAECMMDLCCICIETQVQQC